jgi:hypothetical protein
MRNGRLSPAYLLTLILSIFIVSGGQTVFAQEDCPDDPGIVSPVRPAPNTSTRQTPPRAAVVGTPPPTNPPRRLPIAEPPRQRQVYIPSPPPAVERPSLLPDLGNGRSIFADATPSSRGANDALIEATRSRIQPELYPGRFTVDLSEGINRFSVYSNGGQLIYEGRDFAKLSQTINREIEDQPISTIYVAPTGSTRVQHALFVRQLSRQQIKLNPSLKVVAELTADEALESEEECAPEDEDPAPEDASTESPLVSPGTQLLEGSTIPSISCTLASQCVATTKAKIEGKTGRLSFSSKGSEGLQAFLYSLYLKLSTDLRHQSFETIIKRTIQTFKKTHPGSNIEVQFTTETGGYRLVRIPKRQGLVEVWANS